MATAHNAGLVEVAAGADSEPIFEANAHGGLSIPPATQGFHRIPIQDYVGKVCFPAANGAVAYQNDEKRIEIGYVPVPGSRVDLWFQVPLRTGLGPAFRNAHPQDHYVELEVMGPLTRLEPGESTSLDLTWTLTA